jgi:hypothetical protein
VNEYFGFIVEGGGLRPEDRVWAWAVLVACLAGLAALPFRDRLRLKRRRRR